RLCSSSSRSQSARSSANSSRGSSKSIKEGAINAFAKIVEHRLHPSGRRPPPEPAANSEPESAAQLAQRLELMTRQHAVETAELQMLHQLQLAELRHNHTVALCEHRAALDLEKQAALAEALRFQESEMARQIEAVKSRCQWCATCDREAFFYCCWNTSYCDAACQQRHWPAHMATCAQRGSQRTPSSGGEYTNATQCVDNYSTNHRQTIFLICFSLGEPTQPDNVLAKWYPRDRTTTAPLWQCTHHSDVGTKSDLRTDPDKLKELERFGQKTQRGPSIASRDPPPRAYMVSSAKLNMGLKELFEEAVMCVLKMRKKRKSAEAGGFQWDFCSVL
uniref:MYND-type domain-containing protein n=1 Tax=Macrostomum lignano TaxID=282301 RepID=A0A1I8F8N2_9PLAT